MMDPNTVKQLIEAGLPGCQVMVTGDGSHFEAVVIGAVFDGKTPVQQQKLVYATVSDRITSGELHALAIRAYTPEKWAQAQRLKVGGA